MAQKPGSEALGAGVAAALVIAYVAYIALVTWASLRLRPCLPRKASDGTRHDGASTCSANSDLANL